MFRSIEVDLGTHAFCILVLESFATALKQYKVNSKEALIHQFQEIMELIENVKPRYAILIDSFYKILGQFDGQSVEQIVATISDIKKGVQKEMQNLVKASEEIEVQDKNILIYDHSHSVQNVLSHLYKKGQRFSVLLAEQDIGKTEDNVAFLHANQIPFKVVPAYMLSHLEETIDIAFFGAVTLQEGCRFVMDPGSKSVISELKLEKKKICLFLTTSKFSLWPVKEMKKEIHVKSDIRAHHSINQIEFERIKFSHDRVSVDLVDWVVTEKGIFSPSQLRKEFERQMKEREKVREKLNFEPSSVEQP